MRTFYPGMPLNAILDRSWSPRRKSIKLARGRGRQNSNRSRQTVHRNKLEGHFSPLITLYTIYRVTKYKVKFSLFQFSVLMRLIAESLTLKIL